jgi:hypothetical protein
MSTASARVMTDTELAMVVDRLDRASADLQHTSKGHHGPETSRALAISRTYAQSAQLWAELARKLAGTGL